MQTSGDQSAMAAMPPTSSSSDVSRLSTENATKEAKPFKRKQKDIIPCSSKPKKTKRAVRGGPFKTDVEKMAYYYQFVVALETKSLKDAEKEFDMCTSTIRWRVQQYFKMLGDTAAYDAYLLKRVKSQKKIKSM
jgi:hypothetical protein